MEGGAFAGEEQLSLVHLGGVYFMVPDQAPFAPTAGVGVGKEAYSLLRLPGGGMRFVRLAHVSTNNQAAIQSDEMMIGKKRGDGTRTLRLISSDKICNDTTAPGGKLCGNGASEQVVLHRLAP